MIDKETKVIEAEIQVELDHMWDAARKVDNDQMFSFFSDVLPVGFVDAGVLFPTREAIKSSFRKEFAQLKDQDIDIRDTQIAVLAPNVAITTQCCHFANHLKDGSTLETDGAVTSVFVKEGNRWKVVHGHESFQRPR